MTRIDVSYWSRTLRALRARQGMSQRDLAELLNVNQASISRWERNLDAPSLRHRRTIRDILQRALDSKQDRMLKLRVQYAAWPASLMKEGALFVETSASLAREVGVSELSCGASLYGRFGDEADALMSQWERAGIFSGDLAMTISLNRISTPEGVVYFRGMDTPHISSSGEIWCLCEIRRLTAEEYEASKAEFGGPLLPISYDALN
ncbi:helix-turn-helix transcriptional regulator [Hyphococcus luteus]|uniref:HTH cro/C1-type domain-containing protein n=1 Tax=Hyphococcus luteus TaxID=2058213 RepID=A0A2S7K2M5_9PROT|nr:helix-turn-helix transcriptional regulator [Marinicaulis flavus]PQA86752.1 hypothetical protein CW354_14780 [Marinicaulis flavus]